LKNPIQLIVSIGTPTTDKQLELHMSEELYVRDVPLEASYLIGEGGTPPYSYSVSSGAEPAGVLLESDGKFTGTPTTQGYSEVFVEVSDSAANTFETWFTFQVKGGIAIQSILPYACIEQPYNALLVAKGGTLPYSLWEVFDGALPDGLSIVETDGIWTIEGTPTGSWGTGAELFSFGLRVTDDAGNFAEAAFRLPVWNELTINTSFEEFTYLWANTAFSKTYLPGWGVLGADNPMRNLRQPRVQFSLDPDLATDGVPTGISIQPLTGVVSGFPAAPGFNHVFDVVATDEFGNVATQTQNYRVQATATPYMIISEPFGDGSSTHFEYETSYKTAFQAETLRETDGSVLASTITHPSPGSPGDNLIVVADFVSPPSMNQFYFSLIGL
jgi:hypothetical protein